MNATQWPRVQEVFGAALDLEPAARSRFVVEATPVEPEVRAEVERLLRADGCAGNFIEEPLVHPGDALPLEGWRSAGESPAEIGTLPPGLEVGPYRLVSLLGAGGMGEVYLAEDARLERRVAIKFVLGATAGDRQAIERFQREARAASALNHPGICVVHDVGELAGQPYLVMELLDGQSLKERLTGGPLPPRDVLRLGIEVAEALEATHARGIVHRDIKPANLFLTRSGHAKVLDFGLAKLTADPDGAVEQASARSEAKISSLLGTATGARMGTLSYMSPEQVSGGRLDPRTDVFSLGTVLYEMATGRRPFTAATREEAIAAILAATPPPCSTLVSAVPRALDRVIAKALEKDRERRQPSAGDLARELAEVQRVLEAPKMSRRRLLAASGAVVATAAAAYFARDLIGLWATPRRVRVAVLPFVNLSAGEGSALFAEGLHDDLLSVLGRLYPAALAVIASTSVERYRGSAKSVAEIAGELDVDYVAEGTVRRDGDRVRVSARLIRAREQAQVWSEIFEREVRTLPALQGELAQAVAGGIEAGLRPSLEVQKVLARPINPAAYEAHLRGENAAAIAIDPEFAAAFAGLAESYFFKGFFGSLAPAEAFSKVKDMAGRAIALDRTLAAAYGWRALGRAHGDWDWAGSEADFRRAVELQPSNVEVRHLFAHFLLAMNRGAESAAECDQALGHDPFNAGLVACLGWHQVWAGTFEDALATGRRALEMDPEQTFARLIVGWACEQLGRYDEAIAALRETWNGAMPQASLAHALALSGRPREAREILDRLLAARQVKYVPAYDIAVVQQGLGDRPAVFEWLNRAVAERSALLIHIAWDPRFRPLSTEPRFRALVRGMGLPERGAEQAPRNG